MVLLWFFNEPLWHRLSSRLRLLRRRSNPFLISIAISDPIPNFVAVTAPTDLHAHYHTNAYYHANADADPNLDSHAHDHIAAASSHAHCASKYKRPVRFKQSLLYGLHVWTLLF